MEYLWSVIKQNTIKCMPVFPSPFKNKTHNLKKKKNKWDNLKLIGFIFMSRISETIFKYIPVPYNPVWEMCANLGSESKTF